MSTAFSNSSTSSSLIFSPRFVKTTLYQHTATQVPQPSPTQTQTQTHCISIVPPQYTPSSPYQTPETHDSTPQAHQDPGSHQGDSILSRRNRSQSHRLRSSLGPKSRLRLGFGRRRGGGRRGSRERRVRCHVCRRGRKLLCSLLRPGEGLVSDVYYDDGLVM